MSAPLGPRAGGETRSRRADRGRALGHTLVELLTALAIVACLAMLATASYSHFTVAARRFDARAALAGLAAAQERHFLRHSSYAQRLASGSTGTGGPAGDDDADAPGVLPWSSVSPQAHYTLSVRAVGGTDYRLEARPRGVQARDSECALFVLERSGLRTARNAAGEDTTRRCWAGA